MYETEIKDLVYACSGNKNAEPCAITYLEFQLKQSIKDLVNKTLCHPENVKKVITSKTLLCALEGTPEYYGSKRCLILEQISKKVCASDELSEIQELVIEEAEVDNAVFNTDPLDIFKLDDNSPAYVTYKENYDNDLKYADFITRAMDMEEYLQYSNCVRTTFVYKKVQKFCEWIDISPKTNRNALTILGWVTSYRLKRLVSITFLRLEKNNAEKGLFASAVNTLRNDHALTVFDMCTENYETKYTATAKRRGLFDFLQQYRYNEIEL